MLKICFLKVILIFWLNQLFVCPVASFAQTLKKNVVFPVVNYIENKPIIDGLLDDDLVGLPERQLSIVAKTNKKNPDIKVSYRMAYGAEFFYVYIEADGDELVFRDRAFQNGDGFSLLLCLPKEDEKPTDDFYVLACSAVNDPRLEWTRKIFWYINVYTIFEDVGEDTVQKFAEHDGKISFELYLPWKDIYPYHPWISHGIGFNISLVKAFGERDRSRYFAYDESMHAENSLRKYVRLSFEKPVNKEKTTSYLLLDRNNFLEGEPLKITIATIAHKKTNENINMHFITGEGYTVIEHSQEFILNPGLNINTINISEIADLPAAGYKVFWRSQENDSQGETAISIMPSFSLASYLERLSVLSDKMIESSYETFYFLGHELARNLTKTKSYETDAKNRLDITRLFRQLEKVEEGIDFYALNRGFVRKAYISTLDDTYQPYVVKVPQDYDATISYPLIVFLHGSASDEWDIASFSDLIPDNCIGLGPFGRGHSNGFMDNNAQDDIRESIAAVKNSYNIDAENIILIGFSMGGTAVFPTYALNQNLFKAVASFSGRPYSYESEHIEALKSAKFFIFGGRKDNICKIEDTEKLVGLMQDASIKVNFYIDEESGHAHPSRIYVDKYLDWLDSIIN